MLPRFYLVIDRVHWLPRFLPLGLKLVQLRIKTTDAALRRAELSEAIAICRKAGALLVVNDYWQEAIELGADWLHLGQEDLVGADLAAIRRAGIKLGISTHSHEELETALGADPDYVALGPIWPTTLKQMPFAPQGLERIGEWRRLANRPVVAIGGITLERAPSVFAAGADSIAVVSDVLSHTDPEGRLTGWLSAAST